MNLFEIIANRPLCEDPETPLHCVRCKGTNIETGGLITTLVGWSRGPNPNHTHQRVHCNDCDLKFTRETRRGNVWYSHAFSPVPFTGQEPISLPIPNSIPGVLFGVPNCYETYVLTCAKCRLESVVPIHTDLKGNPTNILSSGPDGKRYKCSYKCTACGHGGEVADDYWRGTAPTNLTWLRELYEMKGEHVTNEALDKIFQLFDELHSNSKWGLSNEYLELIDIDRLSPQLLVGVLSATYPAMEHLPFRAVLIKNVREQFTKTIPHRVDKILAGLEKPWKPISVL